MTAPSLGVHVCVSVEDFVAWSLDVGRQPLVLRAFDEDPKARVVLVLQDLSVEALVRLCDAHCGCEVLIRAYRLGVLSPGLLDAIAEPLVFMPLAWNMTRPAAVIFWFFLFDDEQRSSLVSTVAQMPWLLAGILRAWPLLGAALQIHSRRPPAPKLARPPWPSVEDAGRAQQLHAPGWSTGAFADVLDGAGVDRHSAPVSAGRAQRREVCCQTEVRQPACGPH